MNEIDLSKEMENAKIRSRQRKAKKKSYLISISIYILMMFVLNGLILLAFKQMPNSMKTYSKDEVVLEHMVDDVSGIAFMDADTYDIYIDQYDRYIGILGWTYDYNDIDEKLEYILYNKSNPYVDKLLFTWNYDHTVMVGFDSETLLKIYTDGPDFLDYWDDDETLEITRYQTDEISPFFVDTDDIIIIDSTATSLSQFYGSLYNFFIYLVLIVLLLVFLIKDLKTDFKLFKSLKIKKMLKIILLGYLFVFVGSYLSSFVSKFLSNALSIPMSESVNQMGIVRSLNSNGMIFTVISVIIFAPIVEELIFRKAIFGLIRNKYVALVLSSIVFAAIHLTAEASIAHALISGVSYFTMGLIFGFIYIRNKKNITAPIIVHMLNNLISTLLILFL